MFRYWVVFYIFACGELFVRVNAAEIFFVTCGKDNICQHGVTSCFGDRCLCPVGLSGDDCGEATGCSGDLKTSCDSLNLTCIYDAKKTNKATCDCKEENQKFDGKICREIDTTDADHTITEYFATDLTTNSNECYCGDNSISCRLNWKGNKLCFCKDGFEQRRGTETCSLTCQSNADCRNGGICGRDGPGYFCICPEPYTGDRCEVDVCSSMRFECRSMGAVCVRYGTAAKCECPKGKTMSPHNYCKDTCTSETCVHGICELTYSSSRYLCSCYEGYYGRHCESSHVTVTLYGPFTGILVILGSGIVLFTIASIIAGCWVKKLRKKIEENAKHNLQP